MIWYRALNQMGNKVITKNTDGTEVWVRPLIIPNSDRTGALVLPLGAIYRESDFTKGALKEILIAPWLDRDYRSSPMVSNFVFAVCADFYKTTIDNRANKVNNLRRIDPRWKEWVNHEVILMRSLWKLLGALWLQGNLFMHPVQALARLLEEMQLVLVSIFHINQHGKTSTANLKRLQQENRQLQKLQNPFRDCYTAEVIEAALFLADRNDDFRKTEYKNFVVARQAMTSLFKGAHYTADPYTGKRLDQRGRRKKQPLHLFTL